MPKRIVLASVATMLTMGGLVYGSISFTSRNETCPLEGTPACPKQSCAQAGTLECPYDKAVTSTVLSACCKAK